MSQKLDSSDLAQMPKGTVLRNRTIEITEPIPAGISVVDCEITALPEFTGEGFLCNAPSAAVGCTVNIGAAPSVPAERVL